MAASSINHNIIKSKKDIKQFCKAITEAEDFHNNNKPIIFTISGKAGSGKDYTGKVIANYFRTVKKKKVLVIHFADLLKFICTNFFNWNGQKDESGRELLQYVGTDIVRTKNQNYWVDFIKDMITFFDKEWDYVVIPDARFPNEIDLLKNYFRVISINVERTDNTFNNELTDKAKAHISENALNNYQFDYLIGNNGTNQFDTLIVNILTELINSEK